MKKHLLALLIGLLTALPTTAQTPRNPLVERAANLNQEGIALLNAGQADRALTAWEEAHKIYSQMRDAEGSIGTEINQAQALQAMGFYEKARTKLELINKQLKQQPNSPLKVRGLFSLGTALQRMRVLDNKQDKLGAIDTLKQALTVANNINDRETADKITLSLANTLQLRQGDIAAEEMAIEKYQELEVSAIPIVKVQAKINLYKLKPDPNPVEFIKTIQSELAAIEPNNKTINARIHLADNIKAKIFPKNIENEVKKESERLSNPQGNLLVAKAEELLTAAIDQARTIKDNRGEAQALGSLGDLYQLTGKNNEAKNLTQKAIVIAENLPAPDIAYRLHWQLGRILQGTNPNDLKSPIAAYSQAVNHLKSLRNDLNAIDADLQFSFRDSVEPIYREYVELLLRGDGQQLSQTNLAKARDTIESLQVAEVANFLRQGCLDTYTVSIDKIDRSAAVIYPIVLEDGVHTIASLPGQPLRHHRAKMSAETVTKIVKEMRRIIIEDPNFSAKNERDLKRSAQQIYDSILAPLAVDLERTQTKTLVFVLDGAFRNIPMSVLYDGNQYLVEKYSLALTPGLQLVPPQDASDRTRSQALLGGISEGRQGFASLPGVKPELESIGRLIPSQKLLNEQFSTSQVSTNLVSNNAPIVHFATHGQFSSKADETFILTWDKRLDLDRFSSLLKNRSNRSNSAIELLVLSACQTATGDSRATLGLAGVAIRARAKSTIASLWAVSDEATQDLMVNLYQNLASKKLSKGEALRQAQQAILRNPQYRSPYFWAPFILVGNWQ